MKTRYSSAVLFVLLVCLTATPGFTAEDSDRSGQRRQGPPAEAYEHCDGKSEGDAVSFTNRRGEDVQGTCRTTRDGRLAAVPDDMDRNNRQRNDSQRP